MITPKQASLYFTHNLFYFLLECVNFIVVTNDALWCLSNQHCCLFESMSGSNPDNNVGMFYKHLVPNENPSCLKYFCLTKRKGKQSTKCVCASLSLQYVLLFICEVFKTACCYLFPSTARSKHSNILYSETEHEVLFVFRHYKAYLKVSQLFFPPSVKYN